MLRKFWNNISNIGVSDDLDTAVHRQILLLNRICFVVVVLAGTKLAMEIAEADWMGAFFAGTFVVLLAIPILTNYFQKFSLSKWLTVVFFVVPLIGLKVMYGGAVGSDFAYMIILATSFVIFSKTRNLTIAVLLIVTSYLIGSTISDIQGPLRESHTRFISTYHFFFMVSAFISLLITRMSLIGERNEKEKSRLLLSELKEHQNQIEFKNRNLERLNNDMERFVYMASHDLKTPLRNITSFLTLIKRKVTHSKDPELMEYLEFVSSNSLRMHHLIEDILSYSVLNKNSSSTDTLDLNMLMGEVRENMASLLLEKNGLIRFTELPSIRGDRSKFLLLFQNLVENALKYNRNPVPNVHLSFLKGKDEGSIIVRDNGIGIPVQYREKIFEMFTRLHNVEEFSGTGIGLATCKRIVEKSGGKISVESTSEGSAFYLTWPLNLFDNLPVQMKEGHKNLLPL